MATGIYKIVVLRSDSVPAIYVGQASNLIKRQREHVRRLRIGAHENRRLQRCYDKYGEDSFSFHTVLLCVKQDLAIYEQAILNFYIGADARSVLNIHRECVLSSAGVVRSAETRAKLSAAKAGKPGRKWTEESKAKIRETKRGSQPSDKCRAANLVRMIGSRASAETRAKMSVTRNGMMLSEATKARMSEARSALYQKDPTVIEKLSRALMGNKNGLGSKRSEDTKRRLSELAKVREARKREARSSSPCPA